MQGTISNANLERGFGFVRGFDGETYFYPFKNVEGDAVKIGPGDLVSFSPGVGKRGLLAHKVRKLRSQYMTLGGVEINTRLIKRHSVIKVMRSEERPGVRKDTESSRAYKKLFAIALNAVGLGELYKGPSDPDPVIHRYEVECLKIEFYGRKPDIFLGSQHGNVQQMKIMIDNMVGV